MASDEQARQYWDDFSYKFDQEPDHGLANAAQRDAWLTLLSAYRQPPYRDILDLGCGTGTLTKLLSTPDKRILGIDFSPRMVEQARAKCRQLPGDIEFRCLDAFHPVLERRFDLLVSRHVLWMSADIQSTLANWTGLLRDSGALLLIEGFWHTGAGLSLDRLKKLLPPDTVIVREQSLSDQPELWGKVVNDERYLVEIRREGPSLPPSPRSPGRRHD